MPDLIALQTRFSQIPIMQSLNMELLAVSVGRATMRLPYQEKFDGVFESLHGGVMMTLSDTVACAAVMTLAGTTSAITTTDMDIRFLSPCRSSCKAEARVIKFGRTLVPVVVDLTDEQDKLVAIARVTYIRLVR